jgi:hypothetical protein
MNWNDDNKFGGEFEEKAIDDIKNLLGEDIIDKINRVDFAKEPEKQLAGIDIELKLKGYPRIINIQVKSRREITHDFVFAVEKHDHHWELKPVIAEFYLYYITDRVTPYILHYVAIAMIFNQHYSELIKDIKRSHEGNEYFFYIDPEKLHKWNIEVCAGKGSMINNLLPLRAEAQSLRRK